MTVESRTTADAKWKAVILADPCAYCVDFDIGAFHQFTTGLLNAMAEGASMFHAVEQSWDQVFAGNVTFRFLDGSELVIFNDCDEFDYLDRFITPGGDTIHYDALYQPFNVDIDKLTVALKAASVVTR